MMNRIRKIITIFQFLILMCSIHSSAVCRADTKDNPQGEVKGDNANPEDVEVIKNLDLLQDWDIVGPQGPDMKKLDILNAKLLTGVSHAK